MAQVVPRCPHEEHAPLLPVGRRPSLHSSSHQGQEVCFELCFDDVIFYFFFSISCSSLLNLWKVTDNTQL